MFPKGSNFSKLEFPSNLSEETKKRLIDKEYNVFVLKFIVSIIALGLGAFFIWEGIESQSVIVLQIGNNFKIELNKALPGISLGIFSIILMLFSRLNIKIK